MALEAPDGIKLSAQDLGDAMVVCAASELAFGDALYAHDDGSQVAVEAAYVHIMAGALRTARDLQTPEALFGTELSEADLHSRSQVHVLARLAGRLIGLTGNLEPPRWQVLMHETLGIAPQPPTDGEPGDKQTADPVVLSLAARIHNAVSVHANNI
jgi:hypothetical protein